MEPVTDAELRARDELIERHLPLARRLARRYSRSPDLYEDLAQVAALGLVKAVDRYDPARGTSFSSFAVPTILGELKRYFRDTRWALHVPRDLQERAQRVENEIERLTAVHGRAPTPRDVARAIGVSVEDVLEARDAFNGFEAASLDAPVADEDSDTTGDLIGADDDRYEIVDELASLEPALELLSDRDRRALEMRFIGDMTQAEIGERLGVSQMQVSRILRRALATLREAVAAPA